MSETGSDVRYWQALCPHLKRYGITRIADVTGLDRLGIPVVQAVRPGALSNAVTQGKGLSKTSAAISAAVECIEMRSGENLDGLPVWSGEVPGDVLDAWRPLAPGFEGWPDAATRWLTGRCLRTGAAMPVPMALCSTDFSSGGPFENDPVLRSSIGLGAGANEEAAIRHGLLECIENDARIRLFAAWPPDENRRITDCPRHPEALARTVERVRACGLRIHAWDMTQQPGPVCVMVRVMEDPHGNPGLALPAEGFAVREDRGAALLAALLEAVQARLAVISGAREDMTRALYRHGAKLSDLFELWDAPEFGSPASGSDDARPVERVGLDALLEVMPGPVVAVPLLADEEIPLHVVRVLAPELMADPMRLGGTS